MKSRLSQLSEKLYTEKKSGASSCDITSSKVHIMNTPIPTELFHELETISSEYNRDINCLAGDFLTLALEEMLEHMPQEERKRLHDIRRKHECDDAEFHAKKCEFNAGGT